MATVSDRIAIPDTSAQLMNRIDQLIEENHPIGELIEKLTFLTLPRVPWETGGSLSPFQGDLDGQCWFWNRAASDLMGKARYLDAAEVWSAHYLALQSLQLKYRQRYHKGTPLCNIGYSFALAGRRRLAARSWLLGVIEDTLTDEETANSALNYQNLVKIQVAPALLDQLISTVKSRILDQDMTLLFPEMMIELWLNPIWVTPSEACLKSIEILCERLQSSYPTLPDLDQPWESTLARSWEFADWVEGVYHGP